MVIKIPEDKNIEKAIEFFKKVKGVIGVERDRIAQIC